MIYNKVTFRSDKRKGGQKGTRELKLFLAVCLIAAALAACLGNTLSQTDTSSSVGEVTEDTVTLKLVFQGDADPTELKKVQRAMNAATVPTINAEVGLARVSHDTFND